MKVLLTGGSGFIAAHCIEQLLERGHDVVFTVRSDEKGQKILKHHPQFARPQLSYVIVEDIAKEDAFDEAVVSDPPFEAVLHTASPFHFNFTDTQRDLLDPAIIGTTSILRAIKAYAPTVQQVVITSSFAAITHHPVHAPLYDESVWNPVTLEQALADPHDGYRGSKTFAERAAWEFAEKEKPNFSISTINPPMVYGPVVPYLSSLDAVNTSNARIAGMIQGKNKENLGATGAGIWADVRDVALAHVRAMERPEAKGKRFFITAGRYSNADMARIIKENFPQFKDKLPEELVSDLPEKTFEIDTSRSTEVLGLRYMSLKECVVDTVRSMLAVGA